MNSTEIIFTQSPTAVLLDNSLFYVVLICCLLTMMFGSSFRKKGTFFHNFAPSAEMMCIDMIPGTVWQPLNGSLSLYASTWVLSIKKTHSIHGFVGNLIERFCILHNVVLSFAHWLTLNNLFDIIYLKIPSTTPLLWEVAENFH